MAVIHVTNRAGEQHTVEAKPGNTIMEILRDAEMDVEAICGGCCSCATCHVIVDDAYAAKLPEISEDESDLLDGSEHRVENSRLSCQVAVTPELDGMTVTIAEED